MGPTVVGALVESEQEREQADGQRRDAEIVEPTLLGRGRVGRHDLPGHEDRESRDRQVEKEDPSPSERVGEDAADERADGVAEAGGAEDQAAGQAFLALGQQGVGHPHDRGPHHRAADSHHGARAEERADVRSHAADQGEQGEEGAAEEEDAPPPEHVGEPSAGHDRDPEDQGIAVDDPLRGRDVGLVRGLDRGDGHRERREVVCDDEDGDAHRGEPEAGGAVESGGAESGGGRSHRVGAVSHGREPEHLPNFFVESGRRV